jgi:hypothetical protein
MPYEAVAKSKSRYVVSFETSQQLEILEKYMQQQKNKQGSAFLCPLYNLLFRLCGILTLTCCASQWGLSYLGSCAHANFRGKSLFSLRHSSPLGSGSCTRLLGFCDLVLP